MPSTRDLLGLAALVALVTVGVLALSQELIHGTIDAAVLALLAALATPIIAGFIARESRKE